MAAVIAALPLVGLVAFSAVERYNADFARSKTRATSRADLYATLLEERGTARPSNAELEHLLSLNTAVPGNVVAAFGLDGRVLAVAGVTQAITGTTGLRARAAIAGQTGSFDERGADGVQRVWGFTKVANQSVVVGFGTRGVAVYGAAKTALKRELALALAAVVVALVVAFVLGSRVTAPIRRLALGADAGDDDGDELARIERRIRNLGVAVETSEVELARHAERLAALSAIDRAILTASTPAEIASAAVVRLREVLGAQRAGVMLFDRDREHMTQLAIAAERPSATVAGSTFVLDTALYPIAHLLAGRPAVHTDLATLEQSLFVSQVRAEGVASYVSVPLVAEDHLLGSVNLGYEHTGPPTADTLIIASEVADQLAIALRHATMRAELQAVIDGALDGIAVVDSQRRFITANPAALAIFGMTSDELVGRTSADLLGTDPDDAQFQQFLREGTLDGIFTVTVAGRLRTIEIRARANVIPGEHMFVLRDISDRHRLEEQLRQAQKMEAIGRLAGGVAHDFNNLLTAISGYSALARAAGSLGEVGRELDGIDQASERAVQLTSQLLAFSRRQVLAPVVLDLSDVVTRMSPMLTRLIGEDIQIAIVADIDLPPLLADRVQIEQVVLNLAINARDAMPTGGVLTIETRSVELDAEYLADHSRVEPGRYVCLTVTDTGVGIDAGARPHIFEPFFTTKATGQGTGLGLATVHGIVTQSGGHIVVYSEPDLGTTFKVFFPAHLATVDLDVAAAETSPSELRGTETVLVCEDEDLVRSLVERMLVQQGYTVLCASHPEHALALASTDDHIDLLVTDVVMPHMSGPELVERLATLRPGLPVLFVSGYSHEIIRDRSALPPGSVFLEKPFSTVGLLSAVRNLIDQHVADPVDGLSAGG
jgi:PAS domain S-box-containing protein